MYCAQRPTRSTPSHSLGVLIVNTGTPSSPDPSAVRRFLAQFLADPNVINYPRWLWLPLLHGVILRVRPKRSARLYERIWTEKGSPLLVGTCSLAGKIEAELEKRLEVPFHVVAGMRYGEPSIATALAELREKGVGRILVLPLFPQYSGTTSGTIQSAVGDVVKAWSIKIPLSIIPDYHDHPAYIRALVGNIRHQIFEPIQLLFSFHGIPHSYGESGDPYESQCRKSATLIAEGLNLKPEEWSLAFQSRFGPQEWLTPYTDKKLIHYGEQQLSLLNVVCPGFAIDCLETLDEIAIKGANAFQKAGGGQLNYIPALNDSSSHVEALSEIIMGNL